MGIIQRSISRSKTDNVPIQKTANNSPARTTPAQVCSQLIEARKVGSISTSGANRQGSALEVRRQRGTKRSRRSQRQRGRAAASRPVVGVQQILDIEARDQEIALGARILECVAGADVESRPVRQAAAR